MYNVSDVSSVGSTCSFTAYGEGMTGKGISGGKKEGEGISGGKRVEMKVMEGGRERGVWE